MEHPGFLGTAISFRASRAPSPEEIYPDGARAGLDRAYGSFGVYGAGARGHHPT